MTTTKFPVKPDVRLKLLDYLARETEVSPGTRINPAINLSSYLGIGYKCDLLWATNCPTPYIWGVSVISPSHQRLTVKVTAAPEVVISDSQPRYSARNLHIKLDDQLSDLACKVLSYLSENSKTK